MPHRGSSARFCFRHCGAIFLLHIGALYGSFICPVLQFEFREVVVAASNDAFTTGSGALVIMSRFFAAISIRTRDRRGFPRCCRKTIFLA
jgi:hypothetical protein